jgi:hypothetical protein
VPYQDQGSYLLLCLHQAYGAAGLRASAGNVLHLQHNIRTAVRAGSNSAGVGAIAVLPWLQAELCLRRERTRVVWPEDGALAMPIGYMLRPDAEARLQPLVAHLRGPSLARMLARNGYPRTHAAAAEQAFPPGARLRWPGWDFVHGTDLAAASSEASARFFAARYGRAAQVSASPPSQVGGH